MCNFPSLTLGDFLLDVTFSPTIRIFLTDVDDHGRVAYSLSHLHLWFLLHFENDVYSSRTPLVFISLLVLRGV